MRRTLLATTAALALGMAQAPAGAADYLVEQAPFDWSGLYAGLHAGYLWGQANATDEGIAVPGSFSGFIGGGLVGYGWQHNNLIFGVEGDFGFSNAGGNGIFDATTDLLTYDLPWNAHIRGVLGWAHGNFKPFIAGGLAVAEFNVSDQNNFVVGGTYTGLSLGGGVDVRFANGWIGRVEVLYDDYNTTTVPDYSASPTTWTARLALLFDLL